MKEHLVSSIAIKAFALFVNHRGSGILFNAKCMLQSFNSNKPRSSLTSLVLGVLSNGHQFKYSQGHLLKAKPCVCCGIRASRVLRIPMELVEVHIFTERQPGHSRFKKKKKKKFQFKQFCNLIYFIVIILRKTWVQILLLSFVVSKMKRGIL